MSMCIAPSITIIISHQISTFFFLSRHNATSSKFSGNIVDTELNYEDQDKKFILEIQKLWSPLWNKCCFFLCAHHETWLWLECTVGYPFSLFILLRGWGGVEATTKLKKNISKCLKKNKMNDSRVMTFWSFESLSLWKPYW